ncbi:MAG: hypothetical protein ACK2UX_05770, partial [Anaerolineae bacterium]
TLAFLANGLLALGYYLPLIGATFQRSTGPTVTRARPPTGIGLPLAGLCGLVLAMGLHPAPWLEWISAVGPALLAWGH